MASLLAFTVQASPILDRSTVFSSGSAVCRTRTAAALDYCSAQKSRKCSFSTQQRVSFFGSALLKDPQTKSWKHGTTPRLSDTFRGPVAGVQEISDDTFDEKVLKSTIPTVVEFYATWCGPCKLVAPLLDWLNAEYGDSLNVFKIEADPNPTAVSTYKIYGLPAILVFENGEIKKAHEGAITKKGLKALVESSIPSLAK
mmetsp:Transcript_21778/g.36022  ORF Transcript_21778/g.36022 Transcript_21778/m.36022 type:complete len:199 (-) Transcript_21778:245-841(-)|eukprot:CAMPEP_0184656638 /NCGR_PEP_ID=MMETSP0308-20130426/16649_1 /TAXON_ID=38269 /ORGANISM="Gloeochaete witrockiana, Strain SAG 46.84" /LENGTH=198 /DNA_ID=CAMNT_0027093855 /DNA_START=174 /DNA_END=770 /DNA_ORIENTATION=+